MNAQRLGLAATVLAVLLLLGSLVLGLRGSTTDAAAPASGADHLPMPGDRVRVEVLNAAGVPRLARAATERLRAAGFDVVYYGNAQSFGRDTTIAIARLGDAAAAAAVAEVLDVPAEALRSESDSTRYVDVTVLLGKDLAGLATEDN